MKEGETLLIHAVGSGVGLAALQLAKAKNIKVLGTSRTLEKLETANKFRLDHPILANGDLENFPNEFAEIVRHFTGGNGVDVILDLVGAKYFQANLESLNLKGRLILVGLTSGRKAEFDMGIALAKRLQITGTVLRSRSIAEKAEATAKFAQEVIPLLESGVIRPNLDRVFDFEEIRQAHEYLESNESFGKVVLKLNL